MKETTEQINDYKKEQSDFRFQLDKILSENKRLTRELKDCVKSQLDTFNGADIKPGAGDEVMLQNLQQQLELALQVRQNAFTLTTELEDPSSFSPAT
jgi:hypothetical protein